MKLKLVTVDGIRIDSRRATRRMQQHKIISSQPLAPPARRFNKALPSCRGDAAALLPLRKRPNALSDVIRHLDKGVPEFKDVLDGGSFHGLYHAGDELSRQGDTMIPVTEMTSNGTIRHMGRGVTPVRFKEEFAERLRAARIAAGYQTQAEFAQILKVQPERYKKWESGRTPMPHQYIPVACELLGQDANYLFQTLSRAMRRTA